MLELSGTSVKQLGRKVRILIADDHPVVRRAVRSTLEVHPHFEVCGEAMDGVQAVEETKKLNPDVVVLNVTMPVMNGFEAARRIRTIKPESAIVILSSDADQRFVDEAKKIGVRAYVAKTKAGEALVKAVEAAIRGEDFVVL
jgi:DNA-binding NarL/FixJ family response regulator